MLKLWAENGIWGSYVDGNYGHLFFILFDFVVINIHIRIRVVFSVLGQQQLINTL